MDWSEGEGGSTEEIVWSEKPPFQFELTESPIQHWEFKLKIWWWTVTSLVPPVLLQTDLTCKKHSTRNSPDNSILFRNIDPIAILLSFERIIILHNKNNDSAECSAIRVKYSAGIWETCNEL